MLLKKTRLDGTCDWILGHEGVSPWVSSSDTQLLWIHGAQGCGKSILYGRLLEQLESERPTLYFLFCGGDGERVTMSSLLRAWSLQLFVTFPDLLHLLYSAKEAEPPSQRHATDSSVVQLFHSLINAVPAPIFLTVDALDECEDSSEFLKLCSDIPEQAKILATSRTPISIQKGYNKISRPFTTIELQPGLSQGDISSFIDTRLNDLCLPYSEETISKIRGRLSACDGMFLWVSLMLDHLETQTCEFEVLSCLDDLPGGLPQTYDRALQKIDLLPQSRRMLAYKVFFWVLTAVRPLRLRELRIFLAMQLDSEFNVSRLPPERDYEKTILTVTHGLLHLRGENRAAYFMHHSVTEYLRAPVLQGAVFGEILSCYGAQHLSTNYGLATAVCNQYVRYVHEALFINEDRDGIFRTPPESPEKKHYLIELLDYASEYLATHLMEPCMQEEIAPRLPWLRSLIEPRSDAQETSGQFVYVHSGKMRQRDHDEGSRVVDILDLLSQGGFTIHRL